MTKEKIQMKNDVIENESKDDKDMSYKTLKTNSKKNKDKNDEKSGNHSSIPFALKTKKKGKGPMIKNKKQINKQMNDSSESEKSDSSSEDENNIFKNDDLSAINMRNIIPRTRRRAAEAAMSRPMTLPPTEIDEDDDSDDFNVNRRPNRKLNNDINDSSEEEAEF